MLVVRLLNFEILGFLYLLGAVIFLQILTRKINFSGLFRQKDGQQRVSPERIQLLLATMAASITYYTQAAGSSGGALPDVSSQWLYMFGGSSAVYVFGKAWTTFRNSNRGES